MKNCIRGVGIFASIAVSITALHAAAATGTTQSGVVDVLADERNAKHYIKHVTVTDTGRPEGNLLFDITNGNAVFLIPLGIGIPDPTTLLDVS